MDPNDFGIRMKIPSGWYSEFFQIVKPEVSPATIILSTIPIDASDGSLARSTIDKLGSNDALVSLMVYPFEPDYVASGVEHLDGLHDFELRLGDFGTSFEGVPGHLLTAMRAFTISGRLCQVVAVFGNQNPAIGQIRTIAAAIATMNVTKASGKQAGGNGREEDRRPAGASAR